MTTKTNPLAILVSAVAGMFIGFLWYGLLFQAQWAEAVGLTGPGLATPGEAVMKYGVPVELDPVTPMIINTVILLLLSALMTWLVAKAHVTTFGQGALVGLIVGVFVALMSGIGNLFALEGLALSLIDGSYYLVLFAVIGGIVGGWRKPVAG